MNRLSAIGLSLIGLILMVGCAGDPSRQLKGKMPAGTGFKVHEVNGRRYSVFIPKDYSPGKKMPTVVFLHGIGEGGSNGTSCTTVGLGPAIAKRADTFPFLVVFPQVSGTWKGEDKGRIAMAALADAQNRYAIDPDRIILTGLSTGGYGTWAIGAKYRDQFAALVPMCGYADYEDVNKLTGIPIWCFHNSGDPFVPAGGSKEMVKRIKAKGGNAQYTQYSAFGHNCWDQAYNEGKLFNWMLQQRRTATASLD